MEQGANALDVSGYRIPVSAEYWVRSTEWRSREGAVRTWVALLVQDMGGAPAKRL